MERTLMPRPESHLFVPAPAPIPFSCPILRQDTTGSGANQWSVHLPEAPSDNGLFGLSASFQDTLEQLESELQQVWPKPMVVALPAPALPWDADFPINAQSLALIRLLAKFDVTAGLTLRTSLSAEVLDQLTALRQHVNVTVPVLSTDVGMQKALEPHAVPVPERLNLAAELRNRGLHVQIRIEPILPNLTDTRANFETLLAAIAKCGFSAVSAGYLYLRAGQRALVQEQLEPHGWSELVLAAYANAHITREPGHAPVLFLPKNRRQRGYALLTSIAAELGMEVRLSRTANPDFERPKRPDPVTSARFQAFMHSLRQRTR